MASLEIIVVFGSSLVGGKITDELKDRLDYAIAVYNLKLEQNPNGNIMFILSGDGKGKRTEAEAMADYLIDAGIPGDKILMETSSVNTIENVIYTSGIINNLITSSSGVSSITYVSSEYHLDRIIKIVEVFGVENVPLFAVGSKNYPSWRIETEKKLIAVLPKAIEKYL